MKQFTAKRLYTPFENIEDAVISVDDGAIVAVDSRSSAGSAQNRPLTDLGDCILVPGFVDLHIHGSAGCDVMLGGPAELGKMEAFLARHGVTSYFPTTVTAPLDATLTALEQLADAIEAQQNAARDYRGARPLGIHLEGPFLSHARRGVHPPENLVTPSVGAFDRLWQAARGHVRMMTIAPELDCAEEVIAEASRRGVCVSIGHSDANLEQAQRGVRAGARHATHTFNAMRPLDHREPGILTEVLNNDSLTADLIADGIHVHPSMVRLLARAKRVDNVVLITDAISATGMPNGHYVLGGLEIELMDGRCTYQGKLAGSALTLDRAVRNVMDFAGVGLQAAVQAATANPARAAALKAKGILKLGADADFVALTPQGEVRATVVGGELVQ